MNPLDFDKMSGMSHDDLIRYLISELAECERENNLLRKVVTQQRKKMEGFKLRYLALKSATVNIN